MSGLDSTERRAAGGIGWSGAWLHSLSRATATSCVLFLLSLLVASCGGDGDGSGSAERFSLSERGLDAAADSVRRARRSAPGGMADSGRGTRSSLPAGVPAALDSGNAAYRSGNYRAALEHFESIIEAHPDVQAGWFGIYMAQRALGNRAAADSAMRRAGMGSSQAARVHGSEGDTASPHDFMRGGDTASSPHDFMSAGDTSSMR